MRAPDDTVAAPILRGWAPAAFAVLVAVAGCTADGEGDSTSAAAGPEGAPEQALPETPDTGTPTAVRVPAIGADSDLLHLGLEDDGTASVPEDFDVASWYAEGGRPGAGPPTVLLGHVDSTDGPAVFARLDELEPGDPVEVDTADGPTAEYEVTAAEAYPKDGFPTFEVFGAVEGDALRLVTCSGDFDPDEGSYSDNFVVFAERAQG